MKIEQFVVDAHWPRESKFSQFERTDRLKLCYDLYTLEQSSSQVPDNEKLTLVFATGAQMTKEAWLYHLELISQALPGIVRNAIVVDWVSQGASAKLNRSKLLWYQSWADHARDLNLVVGEALRTNKFCGPAILWGHSMGGGIALFAANFCPAFYAGLVLFDPVWSGQFDCDFELFNKVISKLSYSVTRRARAKFESLEDWQTYESKTVTATMHPRIRKDMEPHLVEPAEDGKLRAVVPPALQGGNYLSSMSTNYAGPTIFKYTPVPAVVARGDIEDWNPVGNNEDLVEFLPEAELVVIPGGGHNILFQLPDKCVAAIAPHLQRLRDREVEYRKGWAGSKPRGEAAIEEAQARSMKEMFEYMQTGKRPALRASAKPKL